MAKRFPGMKEQLMNRDWHFAPAIKFDPELRGFEPVSFQRLWVEGMVGVDGDEHHMNSVNQVLINTGDAGECFFVLKGRSCSVTGI